MVDDTTEWLTTREVMARLGIGRTRLWQLVKAGRLTAYQHGVNRRARHYRRDDVERLAGEYEPVSRKKSGEEREG